MIHAVAAIHKQWGDWGVNRTHVVMVDMDPVCVAMAAVQMTWLPWRVGSLTMLQGDSLAQTQKPIWGWGSVNMPAEYTKVIVKPEPEVRFVVKEDKHA